MDDKTMADALQTILVELNKWPLYQRYLWRSTRDQLPQWATYETFRLWVDILWIRRYVIRTMSGELKVSQAGKDWLMKRV